MKSMALAKYRIEGRIAPSEFLIWGKFVEAKSGSKILNTFIASVCIYMTGPECGFVAQNKTARHGKLISIGNMSMI